MFVEIKGIGFPNKGAELMLATICGRLRQSFGERVRFVVRPVFARKIDSYDIARMHGLYQKAALDARGKDLSFIINSIPKYFRRPFGIVRESECSILLDASGFHLSSQWGKVPFLKTQKIVRRYKARGGVVIFMPQAFGPFEGSEIQRLAKDILNSADYIFARDGESYSAISSLNVDQKRVGICPDMTIGYGKMDMAKNTSGSGLVYIVPNLRVVDSGREISREDYEKTLLKIVNRLNAEGRKVRFMLHEGGGDLEIIHCLNKKLETDCETVVAHSAEILKGYIAKADFVVASRFHALVGALSQNVPVLSLGWSHKYRELLRDYSIEDFNVPPMYSDNMSEKLNRLIDMKSNLAIRDVLKIRNIELNRKIDSMWSMVERIIEEKLR